MREEKREFLKNLATSHRPISCHDYAMANPLGRPLIMATNLTTNNDKSTT
jgi:hypothetical protein